MNASAQFVLGALLAFVRRIAARRTPPPRPAPPPPPPAQPLYADIEAEAVGPMEFWLCPQELAQARREILTGELAELVRFVGGKTGALRDLRALRMPPEQLAALVVVLASDPRVERVRISDAAAARPVIAGVRDLLEAHR